MTGKVTDGSGHGWPLYAKITIDGYPDGPVYTEPRTGAYSVDLPGQADYTLHVSPVYPGIRPVTLDLPVAGADVTPDVPFAADTTQCSAPGYAYTAQAGFEGWRYGAKYGWSVANHDAPHGMAVRPPRGGNFTSGTGDFAAVEPGVRGGAAEDTDLVSPVFSTWPVATSANLDFDTVYPA